jgi:hypothetical protein
LVLKEYRKFSSSPYPEVVKRYQNYQSPVASGVRSTLLHGFQTLSYQIRSKHNVIENKQTKYKLKCIDFLSRFIRHVVRSLILTAFVIPISKIAKSRGAWLWSESEIFKDLRRLVVVRKVPQLFSAYGMCRAIHQLPPYNNYLYIPFTL